MGDIVMSSGNVFADLGRPDAEAMLAKAKLAAKIQMIIKAQGGEQANAAGIIGIPLSELALLLRGRFRNIDEADILEHVTELERHGSR